uniref:Uncharacterized protein n=1 Tax=Phlebotomus papatasi TaxID=29031 RepID=A0A1B0GP39_PHLPP
MKRCTIKHDPQISSKIQRGNCTTSIKTL